MIYGKCNGKNGCCIIMPDSNDSDRVYLFMYLVFFLQWLYKWNFIGQKWIVILRWIRTKIQNKKTKSKWDTFCSALYACIYCQSTWVSIFLCIGLIGFNPIYIIMCMGTNYYFIEKFNKFLYPRYY